MSSGKVTRVEILADVNGKREVFRLNIAVDMRSDGAAIARAGIEFGDLLQRRAEGTDVEIDCEVIEARVVKQWTDVEALPS